MITLRAGENLYFFHSCFFSTLIQNFIHSLSFTILTNLHWCSFNNFSWTIFNTKHRPSHESRLCQIGTIQGLPLIKHLFICIQRILIPIQVFHILYFFSWWLWSLLKVGSIRNILFILSSFLIQNNDWRLLFSHAFCWELSNGCGCFCTVSMRVLPYDFSSIVNITLIGAELDFMSLNDRTLLEKIKKSPFWFWDVSFHQFELTVF